MIQKLEGSTGHKSRPECITSSKCNTIRWEKIKSGMFQGINITTGNLQSKGN